MQLIPVESLMLLMEFAVYFSLRFCPLLQVFKAMRDYGVDWDRGYELMSVAAAARNSPLATARDWIQRLRNLNPLSSSSSGSIAATAAVAAAAVDDLPAIAAAAARRSMSFSVYSPGGGSGAAVAVAKKRTLSEASMEMDDDIAVKRPAAQKLIKKE
jgi:hypothetical protein